MVDVMDINKECCLCLQNFTDPRVLPCLHTFCFKCLENIGATIPNDWFLCPVCGSKFTIPEEGIIGLPKNIFAEKSSGVGTTPKLKSADNPSCDACSKVNLGDENVAEKYCINCEDKLCLKCNTEHELELDHLIVDLSCQKQTEIEEDKEACRCRVHQEETPKLFCTFCKKVICDKCFHERHSSHSCSDITDISSLVCKMAEKEYKIVETMQLEFQERTEKLHKEQMIFLEKVKKIETQILKRCEEVKELVVKETKVLLQELAALKKERLEEIEMEHRRLDKHIFTLEKFKEYCAWIKSSSAVNYTCEAECFLRTTADELRVHESRIENRIFPLQFEFPKTDIREFVMPISNAIGKINVIYPYKMDFPTTINTNGRTLHGMAILQDKLYLLSDSLLIYRADKPYDCVGKVKTPDIKSPTSIVSCCQTSRLYIYDKRNECIWKVSIPDHQVTRWLNKVKEPCTLNERDIIKEQCHISVTPSGEVLITTQSAGTKAVAVEIYNQNAILIERLELPKNIQSLKCVYRTPAGNYIGFGEEYLYKFRADGSMVCQSDISEYPDVGSCVRCLEVSPYQIFLISSSSCESLGFKVSLITSDLAFHSTLLRSKEEMPFSVCYVKVRKRLAVLKNVQGQVSQQGFSFGGRPIRPSQGVTVYNVI